MRGVSRGWGTLARSVGARVCAAVRERANRTITLHTPNRCMGANLRASRASGQCARMRTSDHGMAREACQESGRGLQHDVQAVTCKRWNRECLGMLNVLHAHGYGFMTLFRHTVSRCGQCTTRDTDTRQTRDASPLPPTTRPQDVARSKAWGRVKVVTYR